MKWRNFASKIAIFCSILAGEGGVLGSPTPFESCAADAAYFALRYHGVKCEYDEVYRSIIKTPDRAASFSEIASYLSDAHSLNVVGLRATYGELTTFTNSCFILHLEPQGSNIGHFVFAAIKEKKLHLLDYNARKITVVGKSELERVWTGRVLRIRR